MADKREYSERVFNAGAIRQGGGRKIAATKCFAREDTHREGRPLSAYRGTLCSLFTTRSRLKVKLGLRFVYYAARANTARPCYNYTKIPVE